MILGEVAMCANGFIKVRPRCKQVDST